MLALSASTMQREESNIMSLRDHLLAAQQANQPPPSVELHPGNAQEHHIDPAIAGTDYDTSMDAGVEEQSPEVRKGRRELSTSKRAAQNRAAQRAFRQRKEQYIQTLKDQVKEYQAVASNYDNIEKENFALREYIISLQARLLELGQGDFPPPPVDLTIPRGHNQRNPSPSTLQATAAAAAAAQQQVSEMNNAVAAAAAVAAADEISSRDRSASGELKGDKAGTTNESPNES